MNEYRFLGISAENPIHLNIDPASTDTLCHYTNIKGLEGILSSKCFWVTRSDYLNDLSETIHIKNVVSTIYNSFAKNKQAYYNSHDSRGILLDNFMDYIKYIGERLDNSHTTRDYDIYVLSLSENSDSLALFSYYSALGGCCLGFNAEKLLNFMAPARDFNSYKGLIVTGGNVIYQMDKQVKILWDDIMEVYNSVFQRLKYYEVYTIDQRIYNMIFNELMNFILFKIQTYAMFFKNPSFYHEEEYRVVFIVDEEHANIVKKRDKGTDGIPYIEYKFDYLPIEFIRKSPNNTYNVKDLLDSLGYKGVDILESKIPLR